MEATHSGQKTTAKHNREGNEERTQKQRNSSQKL